MDAIKLLLNDHREMRGYIHDFRQGRDLDAKTKAFAGLVDELDHHTEVEEQVFYPDVRQAVPDTEDIVEEGIEEHHVGDLIVEEAQKLSPDDEQWDAKVTVLCENVEHHIDEEEEELFDQVRKALPNQHLQELGSRMEAFLTRYRLERKTVDELRSDAADLDIEGRSSMTKDQLVEALVAEP